MKIVRILIQTIITLIIAFGAFLAWATFSDYKPIEKIVLEENKTDWLKQDTLSILTWNIGYAGLGADMDFFYDGGENMQTTKGIAQSNLSAILNFLKSQKQNDLILLQEVDIDSKRSYEVNQQEKIQNGVNSHFWYFTYNYKVKFIPIPLGDPLGKVNSGILTGSKYTPANIIRHQFKGNYSWPKSLFMLDRCFTSLAFPINETDTLFVVNSHNTAYDDGNLRAMQMNQLKEWMLKKYQKGHYVIVGADWNQVPEGIKLNHFGSEPKNDKFIPKTVPGDFLPEDWTFAYDPNHPTNRGLDKPLNKNSYKTIIDYFLLSPNLKAIETTTMDLGFKNSDHNPVTIKILFD